MINIESLEMEYFSNELPVPYSIKKGRDISITPIKVKDWLVVEDFKLFNIPKNEMNSIEFIQMSYIQFLHEVYFATYPEERINFFRILGLCVDLKNDEQEEEYIEINYSKGKVVLVIVRHNKSEDVDDSVVSIIDAKEFDEIVKIILFQNIVDYDDEYVSPDVREAIQEYIKLTSKGRVNPTLKDKKIYILSKGQMSMNQINEMSYRFFSEIYTMTYDCEEYLATRIIEASEKFKVETMTKHPLFSKKKTIYEEVFSESSDSLTNRISQVNG